MLIKNKTYEISIIMIILFSFTPAALISNSIEAATANSKIISSGSNSHIDRGEHLAKIRKVLENKVVSEKLRSYGLSTEEIGQKMNQMGDEQIHQLASLADRIPAGGNGAATAAVIVLVVFVIAIILLIVLRRI